MSEQDATVADKPGRRFEGPPTVVDIPGAQQLTLTTASDALHDEEIDRTRLFIRLGWAISVCAIAVVPLLPSPLPMQVAMVVAMLLGIAVSFPLHQRFADPARYTARALFGL